MSNKITRRDFIGKSALGAGLMNLDAKGESDFRTSAKLLDKGVPKRRLGRTNKMISCIGFGGSGSRFSTWTPQESDAQYLIEYAIKLGINYFTSSSMYNYKSEKRYGRYLTPKYRDKIFLYDSTEVRTYDGVMKEIEKSLKNLKTDYIDVYIMMAVDKVKDVETLAGPAGGYKACRRMKDEGVIKHIGCSFHIWNAASQKLINEFDDIEVALCPINASRSGGNEDKFLPIAKQKDIGVNAIKSTGQNALIGNVTGADLCRYALSMPITAVEVGVDGYSTLESCAQIANEPPLNPAQMREIEKRLAFDPKKYRLPYYQGDGLS
ncbi:aldo/keto reductase [candidate division KSB1 bacterium]